MAGHACQPTAKTEGSVLINHLRLSELHLDVVYMEWRAH